MSDREQQPDAIEISDGLTIDDMRRIFGLERPPIDTAERRLEEWSRVAAIGANLVSVDDVLYCWDTKPRRQKNGALIGRVHAKPRGQLTHDIGAYKIDADGRVVQVPAQLRGVLPGSSSATASDDARPENPSEAAT